METDKLENIIQEIVKQARDLKNKHTQEKSAPINYACIFSQNESEYHELLLATDAIGKIIEKTPSGPLFQIRPILTVAGQLKLLKIRAPDTTRTEKGDADFTVLDYQSFKKKHLKKGGFKLIIREKFEMIELKDKSFSVLAYFSNPPLNEQLNIK